MDVGRPKKNDFPPYMTVDGDRGGFIVRNPLTGKKKRFPADMEEEARETAKELAEHIDTERQARAFDAGLPKIAGLVDRWLSDRLPFMPWDAGTREAHGFKLKRIRRELGDRVIARTDCMFLEDWLGFCKTADQWNKWRYVFVLLWKFAVSRKLATSNEPEKIEERSTSKKLEANQKVRQPMDIAGFKAIHAKAPGWLQIGMEQSLVTLQARTEICNMRQADYRDGYLFVIRDKVSGDSDMAFIKIAITDQIEEIRKRTLVVEGITHLPSSRPYLVHRAPDRRRRQWTEGKPHWTYVNPEYLSKAFAEAREASKHYAHLKPDERPSFHEIRGLGARLYLAQGVPEERIQALMTHAHKRTTEIYLDRGAEALTADDYVAVTAPLRLADVLGTQAPG